MLLNDVVGYQYFGKPCCFHLQYEVIGTWKGAWIYDKEYKRGRVPSGPIGSRILVVG
jgi:hypothetical protein